MQYIIDLAISFQNAGAHKARGSISLLQEALLPYISAGGLPRVVWGGEE